MSSSLSAPLSSALTPKKSQVAPMLLLIVGIMASLAAAAYGYIESRRTERVVIAARDIPYAAQITVDDLAVIELPLHRPVQVAGITDPQAVIGQYATRQIGMNDLLNCTVCSRGAGERKCNTADRHERSPQPRHAGSQPA